MNSPAAAELALADARLQAGQASEAVAVLEGAAARHPTAIEVHGRLGVALCLVGRLADACVAFEAALRLDPGFIEARVNLGMTRLHLGDRAAGLRFIRAAIALKPDHADSWQIAASAAYVEGRAPAAAIAAGRALALVSGHGTALGVHALALRQLGRYGASFLAARRAAVLDPREPEMLAIAAVALKDVGRCEEAVRVFRRVLTMRPGHSDARSAMIMTLNYVSSATPADLLHEAREWARWCAPARRPAAAMPRTPGRPLRIGLVSGDFKRHAVGYFLAGALPLLDRRRIEVQSFATTEGSDALTAIIRGAATKWHDISAMPDEAAFDLVRREGIDVLVDMSGYTAGSRLPLFAMKPAPVQAAWIGYFGTTGLSSIDWLIADGRLVPERDDRWFSEKILRLPDSYVCYRPPDEAPAVAPPPSDATGVVTFGSCNALPKITPATIAAWARILLAVPTARLLLKTAAFDAAAARTDVTAAFARHGVDPARLLLEGWSAYGDFLATYGRIDVALDPFPFCGGLSTVETLWMGVPLVTLAADRFAGRQSLSYLTTIGHPELCAADVDAYVAIAIELGRDAERRRALRARLRPDMAASPLLDHALFAGHLADAFERMARG